MILLSFYAKGHKEADKKKGKLYMLHALLCFDYKTTYYSYRFTIYPEIRFGLTPLRLFLQLIKLSI